MSTLSSDWIVDANVDEDVDIEDLVDDKEGEVMESGIPSMPPRGKQVNRGEGEVDLGSNDGQRRIFL